MNETRALGVMIEVVLSLQRQEVLKGAAFGGACSQSRAFTREATLPASIGSWKSIGISLAVDLRLHFQ